MIFTSCFLLVERKWREIQIVSFDQIKGVQYNSINKDVLKNWITFWEVTFSFLKAKYCSTITFLRKKIKMESTFEAVSITQWTCHHIFGHLADKMLKYFRPKVT